MASKFILCFDLEKEKLKNSIFWTKDSQFLSSPTSQLFCQLILVSCVSRFMIFFLSPFGQTTIVSQILGGMIFGPSMLGTRAVTKTLFPPSGIMMIETLASFGNMFYHFLIAVKTDPQMMIKPERVAMLIGGSSFLITSILSVLFSFILKGCFNMNTGLQNSITFIAASQGLTGFPVIHCLITELNIQNTDIGRLSLASAVFTDMINVIAIAVSLAARSKLSNPLMPLWSILSTIVLFLIVVFIIRPVIHRMQDKIPIGKPVDQKHIFLIIIFTLVSGFFSEAIGQHYIYGPLILGLVVPHGPPLGAGLVSRLDTFVTGILYPTYVAISGLRINVFGVHSQSAFILALVFVFGVAVKTSVIMLLATCRNIPPQDAFVLAMIMNGKGIVELSVYNVWQQMDMISNEEFSLCIIMVVITTAIITPLIKFYYDPWRQYRALKRNAIQHSKHGSELRMLVCFHHQENVPTVLKLLEVSNPTEETPISVIALSLVELVGRNTPIMMPNNGKLGLESEATCSIINALRKFEQKHVGCTNIQSYTSISHFNTMNDDVCRLAIEKRASIIIMPFHKQWTIDGTVGSSNRSMQQLNCKVLDKAPCSVGIIVDRGFLNGDMTVLSNMLFKVAVLFLGGPDDAEALAYGSRMAGHGCVNVTVFHFLLFGDENSKERMRNMELIDEYRQANAGNERFVLVEGVVGDGVELAKSIRKMMNCFDLIMVGKYHHDSPLLKGLEDWSECPELGIIGDMLASPDSETTASVLVVQQQRIGINNSEQLIHDSL